MTATAVPTDMPKKRSTVGLPEADMSMTAATVTALRIRMMGE